MFFRSKWEEKWEEFSYLYAADTYIEDQHVFITNFTQVSVLLSNTAVSYFVNLLFGYDETLTKVNEKKFNQYMNKLKKKDFERVIKLIISYYLVIFDKTKENQDFLESINLTIIELEHEMTKMLNFDKDEKKQLELFKNEFLHNYEGFRTHHCKLILKEMGVEESISQVPVVLTLDKALSDIYERLTNDLERLKK